MEKNKKKHLKIMAKIVLYALIIVFGVNFLLGFVNYSKNKNTEIPLKAVNEQGLIINQGLLTDFYLGFRPTNQNGCGVIATYNFLKLNNKEADFNKLLRFYDAYGTNLFGILGVNPFAIQAFLNLKGFNASLTTNRAEMHNLAKESKVSILMYFHNSGAHYITLQYNQANNNFITYNEVYGQVKQRTINEIFAPETRCEFLAMLIYVK